MARTTERTGAPLTAAGIQSIYGSIGGPYGTDSQDAAIPPDQSKGSPPAENAHSQQLSFTGELIDARYSAVTHETLCTYATPLGTYSILKPGFWTCPQTTVAPLSGGR